jgi:hypothetical protein
LAAWQRSWLLLCSATAAWLLLGCVDQVLLPLLLLVLQQQQMLSILFHRGCCCYCWLLRCMACKRHLLLLCSWFTWMHCYSHTAMKARLLLLLLLLVVFSAWDTLRYGGCGCFE